MVCVWCECVVCVCGCGVCVWCALCMCASLWVYVCTFVVLFVICLSVCMFGCILFGVVIRFCECLDSLSVSLCLYEYIYIFV